MYIHICAGIYIRRLGLTQGILWIFLIVYCRRGSASSNLYLASVYTQSPRVFMFLVYHFAFRSASGLRESVLFSAAGLVRSIISDALASSAGAPLATHGPLLQLCEELGRTEAGLGAIYIRISLSS